MINTPEAHEFYENVFDVLGDLGGAPESLRRGFVYCHAEKTPPCDEFRFIGQLGFGGKYRREKNCVTCYSEDRTPERDALIESLNNELGLIGCPPVQVVNRSTVP